MATAASPPTASPSAAAGDVSEVELSEAGSPVLGSRSSGSGGSGRSAAEYSGWVYHLGVNSIGHEYCHLRFLVIRGKSVAMYKRDPHDHPGLEPIRKGAVSHTLMVEELGRRRVNHGDVYVLRLYNRLNQTKKGEIACAAPGEARKWIEAFEQAKQQADYDLMRGVSWNRLQNENEINLDGHRPRVRRYAQGLGKLVRIGKGPEMLLRQSSDLRDQERVNTNFGGDSGDAFEAHEWRYVRTFNGIRIFEDITNPKGGKGILLKSVGVVGANPDTVFEVVLSLDKHKRYEWDMLTADLELVETIDGYCDVVYGTYEPKFLNWWKSKKDFVFSRQWFRGQDGAYTILQTPAGHKKRPPKHGYERTKINRPTKAVSKEVERIDQFFYTYADNSSGMIDPEGIETLCSHLEVPHTDVRILMLAWKMGCEKQGYFTLDEWRAGLKALRADSISKLKKAFPELVQEVTRPSNFQDFYIYAFRYCLTEDKKKCIEIPVACELLNLVLGLQFRPQVDKLNNYLKYQNDYKVINMDQWMGFIRFCNEINFPSLDNYDSDLAWPLILDNFVEWLRENKS